MPPPDDLSCLWDIRYAARLVEEAMAQIDSGARSDDWVIRSAIERQLSIIGEAVKRLSAAYREEHPEVPWRLWAGLRDVIVHQYDAIDDAAIDLVAHADIAVLLTHLDDVLPDGAP